MTSLSVFRAGKVYKYLKIDHAGENIHARYNKLEKKHENQKNRGKRFNSRFSAGKKSGQDQFQKEKCQKENSNIV